MRGCIGSFEPLSLNDKLKEFALVSALEDDRFKPIELKELPNLHVSLSLLVKFSKPLDDPLDWEVGTHGVKLEFDDEEGNLKWESTFLPEFAFQKGWEQKCTIERLLENADYGDTP